MPSKKLIRTPLHLLRDLTGSLVSYFEEACIQVQQDAEKALTKLEKQRAKVQQKLIAAQAKLEKAQEQGKSKAKNKAKETLADLETIYSKIQKQQKKILDYIDLLKKDAAKSLDLSKGINVVHERAKSLLNTSASMATETRVATKPKATVTANKRAVATKITNATTKNTTTKTTTSSKPTTAKKVTAKAQATTTKTKVAPVKKATTTPQKTVAPKAPTKTATVNKKVTKPAIKK